MKYKITKLEEAEQFRVSSQYRKDESEEDQLMQDTKTGLLSVNKISNKSTRSHTLERKNVRKQVPGRTSKQIIQGRDAFVKLRKISSSIPTQGKRRCGYIRH